MRKVHEREVKTRGVVSILVREVDRAGDEAAIFTFHLQNAADRLQSGCVNATCLTEHNERDADRAGDEWRRKLIKQNAADVGRTGSSTGVIATYLTERSGRGTDRNRSKECRSLFNRT
ncbi:uncharacterized protein LOC105199879 [Solenopsis invicta]|uniref:uncharacterized protein LOC105199879 n=1 Tax=Solenopsis invicta TaxID=13686 RepID=UPI00193D416E|nr:uncharacterized protein LOC105199879 [Solenopsis invicta]